jgi:glycosyltransferase involved in cell wall biosynthesis
MTTKPVATALRVGLLPTLPFHAGVSMQVYASGLLEALEHVPGVRAELLTPPFLGGTPPSWRRSRWIRYVAYPRWAARQQADVYHVVDHGNAQLLWRLPRHRTAITCHDLYPLAVARGRLRFAGAPARARQLATSLRLLALRRAGMILAVSAHTAEECRQYLGVPASRVRVVYESIASVFTAPRESGTVAATRAALGMDDDDLIVLHVGSNDPRKNFAGVCATVARLRAVTDRVVRLVKVGAPFGERECALLRTHGLGADIVRHVGRVDDAWLLRLYHAASVLLYPSFHEGFCRPVAEAMAAGLPVVAAAAGAIPEVAAGAAALLRPDDVAGMALAIADLGEPSRRREGMVAAGRERSRRFFAAAHGPALAAAYQEMAGA